MDKATLLKVAANTKVAYPESREKKEGGKKNSARDDGSPSCAIKQRKHFAFLNFQQVDKSPQNPQWRETIAM